MDHYTCEHCKGYAEWIILSLENVTDAPYALCEQCLATFPADKK